MLRLASGLILSAVMASAALRWLSLAGEFEFLQAASYVGKAARATCHIMNPKDHQEPIPRDEKEFGNFDEIRAFNRRGLFLGGCPKSGTTLLLSLLDGHPKLVVVPEETHFLDERPHYLALDSYQARLRRLLEKSGLRLLAQGTVCTVWTIRRSPQC